MTLQTFFILICVVAIIAAIICYLVTPSKLEHSINSVIVQLQDVDLEMEDRLSNDEFDQERLSFIEQRISTLESLKRKYGGSIESIIDYRESIRNELEQISSFVNSDNELKENIKKLEKDYIIELVGIMQYQKY